MPKCLPVCIPQYLLIQAFPLLNCVPSSCTIPKPRGIRLLFPLLISGALFCPMSLIPEAWPIILGHTWSYCILISTSSTWPGPTSQSFLKRRGILHYLECAAIVVCCKTLCIIKRKIWCVHSPDGWVNWISLSSSVTVMLCSPGCIPAFR